MIPIKPLRLLLKAALIYRQDDDNSGGSNAMAYLHKETITLKAGSITTISFITGIVFVLWRLFFGAGEKNVRVAKPVIISTH